VAALPVVLRHFTALAIRGIEESSFSRKFDHPKTTPACKTQSLLLDSSGP
jgi:hypothetical protein